MDVKKGPALLAGGGGNQAGGSRGSGARFSGNTHGLRPAAARTLTRPARAWLPGAAAICAALLWPLAAVAAAPRDAVRNLPQISHRSTFDVLAEDKPDFHSYSDRYTGQWDINWPLPELKLAGGARARVELLYQLKLTDNLNRVAMTSSNSRRDYWRVKLRLTAGPELRAHFQFEQEDVYAGSTPASSPRSYRPVTTRAATVEWLRVGFPSLSVSHVEKGTVEYLGERQTHGSEVATTIIKSGFEHTSGNAHQRADLTAQMIRTSNQLGGTSTSRDNLVFDTSRQLRLGRLGRLALGLRLEENSHNQQDLIDYTRNHATTYSLALTDGATGGPLPLSYGFTYIVVQRGYSGSPGDEQVRRKLNLGFRPAVSAVKRAEVSAEQYYSEFESATANTSTSHFKLAWGFDPNPRTTTSLVYLHREQSNLLTRLRTEDTEDVTASLSYKTPGGQTSYTVTVREETKREPVKDRRSTNDQYNLRTVVNLGPATRLRMFYNQHYSDSYHGPWEPPSGNDQTLSGVTYQTSGNGLTLDATWQQRLTRFQLSDRKKDYESINVALSYATPAGWRYTLKLDTSAEVDPNAANPLGYNYSTKDRIQAIVTYTF